MSKIGYGIASRQSARTYDQKNNVEEWCKLIEPHNPAYFCTFTTKHQLTLNSARTSMEVYVRNLRSQCTVDEKIFFFWVAEAFELKSGFHTHGLLSIPDTFKVGEGFKALTKTWHKSAGTNQARTHFVPVRKQIDGIRYVTKYATKERADWDIHSTTGIVKNTITGVLEAFRK
jgi:hypothetical protein